MTLVFVQTVLVIAAGVGLFWLWRAARPSEPWLQAVVAAGFLFRAFVGQALFWISWARLPIARSMQDGDGLWFFGSDAKIYFPAAVAAAREGVNAVYKFDVTAPSRFYVQTLAMAVGLFGGVVSTALLLNLFCYLGTVAVITRWPVSDSRSRTAAAIAVTALSLSPALMLWSLQPLKDTYFQFLFVSFLAACAAWQRAWTVPGQRMKRAVTGLILLLLLFGLSSIRWYFGFVLLLAVSFFMMLMVFKARGRRLAAGFAAVVMAILLSRSLVAGAGVYLPMLLADALNPRTTVATIRSVPAFLFHDVESARASFDAAGGATSIRAGARLGSSANVPDGSPAQPPPVTVPKPALPAPPQIAASQSSGGSDAAEIRALMDSEVAAWNRGDVAGLMNGMARTPDVEQSNGINRLQGWQSSADYYKAYWARHPDRKFAMTDLQINVAAGGTASVNGRWSASDGQRSRSGLFTAELRRGSDGWKVVRLMAPKPQPPVGRTDDGGGEIQKPSSRGARLVTGAAVLILPRSIGEWLQIFHIGGGKGMLFFTEIDTVIFDAALLLAFFAVASRARIALRDPLTWLTLLITMLIGVPLLYSITNFGTLFRLREMIYIGLVLTPLAVATAFSREEKIRPAA